MAERTEWNSNLVFLLAVIGSAVGLGNIWRFPYLFYTHGQGSFLIPYVVAILIMGIPFLLLEYAVGAKFKVSAFDIFKKVKSSYKPLAWAIVLVPFIITIYYLAIIGWDLNYLLFSVTKAWGSNPDAFFNVQFLQSAGISGLSKIIFPIFIAIIILWFVVWLISSRDINDGIGKFTTIFVPLLFVLGIGVAIFNLTLPGAYIGIMKFFQPNWALLLDFNIWIAAFGQILFTLSLGGTIVMSYASHLPKETNLGKNALIVVMANCGFEIINALGVFALLGCMSFNTGVPINSLITEGSGLAFVAFPQAFNIMGLVGYVIGPLFFFTILIAGITTSISYTEPLLDSISNNFNLSRKKVATLLIVIGCLASLIFTTAASSLLVKIFDTFLNEFVILFLVIVQCIIFAHIYGAEKFYDVLNVNRSFHIGKWWQIIVKYILPIVVFVIWIVGVYKHIMSSDSIHLISYALLFAVLIIVPLLLIYLEKSRVEPRCDDVQ